MSAVTEGVPAQGQRCARQRRLMGLKLTLMKQLVDERPPDRHKSSTNENHVYGNPSHSENFGRCLGRIPATTECPTILYDL